MTLKHSIIHKIERPAPGNDLVISPREAENSVTGPIHSLYEQLKQSFQRSGQKQYGHFDREMSDNPLPQWLKEHQSDKSTFTAISLRLLEHLQEKLSANDEAFSAHILIALETVLDQDLFTIFWINHVDANHIDSNLEVASARFVDPTKLQYAAKIHLSEWLEEESPKYLSLLTSRGNKNLSDAFSAAIGFASGVDLVEETGEFLGILDQYTDTLPADKVSEVKEKVLDYCMDQDKLGRPVVFDEISSQLNESAPEQFSSFIGDRQQSAKTEMYTDRGSLKRYVRFFGRDNSMSISFSSQMFGEDILYDPQTGTLTIKRIPKSLQQQLQGQGLPVQRDPVSDDS